MCRRNRNSVAIFRTYLLYNTERAIVPWSIDKTHWLPTSTCCVPFPSSTAVSYLMRALWIYKLRSTGFKGCAPSATGNANGSMTDSCIAYIRKFTITKIPCTNSLPHHSYKLQHQLTHSANLPTPLDHSAPLDYPASSSPSNFSIPQANFLSRIWTIPN